MLLKMSLTKPLKKHKIVYLSKLEIGGLEYALPEIDGWNTLVSFWDGLSSRASCYIVSGRVVVFLMEFLKKGESRIANFKFLIPGIACGRGTHLLYKDSYLS